MYILRNTQHLLVSTSVSTLFSRLFLQRYKEQQQLAQLRLAASPAKPEIDFYQSKGGNVFFRDLSVNLIELQIELALPI